ncbi:hypothetical protein B0H10DRAFT_1966651 [Mycena sp. CBHHK59/15]|nr:hypothetical protein B0H10DRAFT_1966651 [Mycena sp. CBHHK59/15]
MAVMWNGTRFYIGEIMGLYKKGAHGRYGSVPNSISISNLVYLSLRVYLPLTSGVELEDYDSDSDEDGDIVAPLFSCHDNNSPIRLHTHGKIDHLIFNLGHKNGVFEPVEPGVQHCKLKAPAALCWTLSLNAARCRGRFKN